MYTEQIKRGAAWLDENVPGWENRIDRVTLDMKYQDMCIFGQLDGSFVKMAMDHKLSTEDCVNMGFTIPQKVLDEALEDSILLPIEIADILFRPLTREWNNYIGKRMGF